MFQLFNKFTKYIKTLFKRFYYLMPLEKFKIIMIIIIFIDSLLFVSINSYRYFEYKKSLEKYESNKIAVNIQKNIFDKDFSFKDILNKVNNIEYIQFLKNKDNYVSAYFFTKDKNLFKYKDIYSYSISSNIEPILIQKNIPYSWVSSINKEGYIYKPEFKKVDFLILSYISDNLITLFIYGFLIFYLLKTMPNIIESKFDYLFPSEIKENLSDLVGMDTEIRHEILQLKDMILNQSLYKEFGIDSLFNILFSGPAGTGKSKTALALAKELNVPILIGTGNIETGFIGGGASVIKSIFKTGEKLAYISKLKTAIIFLDESQTLLYKRGVSREKWADDSANELLAQLEGVSSNREVNLIFIAASNFDDSNFQIDEAMERRFKKKIFFKLPDQKERLEIIRFYINKIDQEIINLTDKDIEHFSKITTNLSPAKIETIIKDSTLQAIRKGSKITKDILYKSYELITIGHTNRDLSKEDNRERIIIHELGHFITEYERYKSKGLSLEEIKDKVSLIKISSESISKYNVLGYVMNEPNNNISTKEDLEEEIISLYGGYVAESHFYSSKRDLLVSTGSFNDIEKVTDILELMIVKIGMYSSAKINLKKVGLEDNESIKNKFNEVSELLFEESMKRIIRNEELILYLKKVLIKEWVLYKESLFEKINEFEGLKK